MFLLSIRTNNTIPYPFFPFQFELVEWNKKKKERQFVITMDKEKKTVMKVCLVKELFSDKKKEKSLAF